ncbi:MAG: hypothetical protein Q4E41_06330 [Bacteroidales bacterium]|nr:hypothetical protein [Bacteroidales bacterium]
MSKIKYFLFFAVTLFSAMCVLSSCSKDDDDSDVKVGFYDVIQINGESYACYGYRSIITYESTWNLYQHKGQITLPCGKLSDAQKGEYDYDYLHSISLAGTEDLRKGSKLEDFSPVFATTEDVMNNFNYVSGSATITDKKDDKYITVKFDSFKFASGSKSYVLNGTVQLALDED